MYAHLHLISFHALLNLSQSGFYTTPPPEFFHPAPLLKVIDYLHVFKFNVQPSIFLLFDHMVVVDAVHDSFA